MITHCRSYCQSYLTVSESKVFLYFPKIADFSAVFYFTSHRLLFSSHS